MDQKPETILWTAEEIAAITGGRWETAPAPGLGFSLVHYDAREIKPGCLFITRDTRSWPGRKYDGGDRAVRYIAKGAAAVVVDRVPKDWAGQGALLVVANTRTALMAIATAGRARFKGKVVTVTGTVGKTSTKEFLRQGLGAQAVVSTSPNAHSHGPGVGMTLANLPPDADYAVVEVGMSRNKGAIRERVSYVRPDIAVITDVGYDHLRGRNTLDDVAIEKAEILSAMADGGIAVLNRDTPAYALLAAEAERYGVERIVTTGWGKGADSRVLEVDYAEDQTTRVRASILGEPVSYTLTWLGRPPAFCAMLALTVARLMDADWRAMCDVLPSVAAPPQRMERFVVHVPGGEVVVFDDNYNASPKSMLACFDTAASVRLQKGGRRIAVLSDMAGMGTRVDVVHRDLADPFRAVGFDMLFTFGEKMTLLREALGDDLPPGGHFESVKTMALAILQVIEPGDVVFLKGSDPKPEFTALDQVLHAIQSYGFTGVRALV